MTKQDFVEKFKELYRQKNGAILSDDIALKYFENLVCLVEAIYQPKIITKQNDTRNTR